MKKLYIILLAIFLGTLLFRCTPKKPTTPPVMDCKAAIDSTNDFWKDVIKNLTVTDTNWIDSVRWTSKDSINWIDSTRYVYKDSLLYPLGKLVEIKIDSVKADTIAKSTLAPDNMIDYKYYFAKRNPGTRWAAPGYPHSAVFYFDGNYLVTEFSVNVYGWDENYTHDLAIYHYADLVDSFTTAPVLWSNHKIFYTGKHLYLMVNGGGNNWTDIGGVRLFGYKLK